MQHALSPTCREIIISPEMAVSETFRKEILIKREFWARLRVVVIDEAHCVCLWGGSFRGDYAALGVLRERIKRHVPFLVASATLPTHVLDNVRSRLKLSEGAWQVRLSNDRPNVALSCRFMEHSNESKADLRFLIPHPTQAPADIPITLIYCNQRLECEDITTQLRAWGAGVGITDEAFAFYHAKIGSAQKRDLERRLRDGNIRILACTDAVGMVCMQTSCMVEGVCSPESLGM